MSTERSDRHRYEPPAIVQREPMKGVLVDGVSPSDQPDGTTLSDVRVKENIRPVRW
jgi:hypothetical protein